VLVVVINRVVELSVENSEVMMVTFLGFKELLNSYKTLPDVGWLYVDESFNLGSKDDIVNGRYYLAENEDEEMDFEESYGTFLESPIFKAIVDNTLDHHPDSGEIDFLNATLYYLENDDFLD
jgi:hypothetical protein